MIPNVEDLVGRIVDGYLLATLLGAGGAGAVFLATKADTPEHGAEQAAVKVLLPATQATAADRAEIKTRFEREARALQLVQHLHILSLLGYGEDTETGLAYMVLPYTTGGASPAALAWRSSPGRSVTSLHKREPGQTRYLHYGEQDLPMSTRIECRKPRVGAWFDSQSDSQRDGL
jgi:serine/threonine protein kinase